MRLPNRTLKLDALAFDLEEHAALLIMDGAVQLRFEFGYLGQDLLDSIIHRLSMSLRSPASPRYLLRMRMRVSDCLVAAVACALSNRRRRRKPLKPSHRIATGFQRWWQHQRSRIMPSTNSKLARLAFASLA